MKSAAFIRLRFPFSLFSASLLCLCLLPSALRAESVRRTWRGTDGAWASADNWSPSGVPNAGDVAYFPSGGTVSGEVPLAGDVAFEVESNQTLTVSGSIRGAGGVVKLGCGKMVVVGNNSFAGSFVVSNGAAVARGVNALGDNASGAVEVRAIDKLTMLYLGGVHVRKRLVLHNRGDSQIHYNSFFVVERGTTNRVSGELEVPSPYLRMVAEENSRIDFAGGGSFGASSAFLNRRAGAEIRVVGKPMQIVNRFNSTLTPGWLVLGVPGVSFVDKTAEWQNICIGNRRTTVDGALAADSVLNGGSALGGVLDLAGTRQTIKRLFNRWPYCGGVVTSAAPASLTLTDAALYTNACVFAGQVSLTLAGAGAKPVVITGKNTSQGILTVEAGKLVEFADGAAWRGGVVVKGTLDCANSNALASAAFVDLHDGGSLTVASRPFHLSTLPPFHFQWRTNGIAVADAPTTRTYVGTDGLWTSDANWNPVGVPRSGDVALFTSTATISEDFDLPGGATTISESSSSVKVTLAGVIGGAEATLVHAGPGTLTLSADNTFTGAFTNRAGSVCVPALARAGVPSPIGAGAGEFAEIVQLGGVFTVVGAGRTDRPVRAAGQFYVNKSLDFDAPVAGSPAWRGSGTVRLNAPCPDLTLHRTDGGTVEMNCATNSFGGWPSFSAGVLRVASIADGGQPSPIGVGTGIDFGQSGYPTPSAFCYSGASDAVCNRAIGIRSCEGKIKNYPSTYDLHEGPAFIVERAGVKVKFTGAISLNNADAKNPFILCGGAGDVEMTAPIPHRFHLWKYGTGTWALAGANAATGVCTVTAGRLDLDGSFARGMTLAIRSGATFGGAGRVDCAASFASGATLAAGSASRCGTLTFAAPPSFPTDFTYVAKVGGGTSDCVRVAGAAAWPETMTVRVERIGRVATGDWKIIAWDAPPATKFVRDGDVGRLEKRADGLYLAVNSPEDFFAVTRSSAAERVISVAPGSAVATLADALGKLRSMRGDGALQPNEPVAIELAPGDYVLDSTLDFTTQDSGSRGASVTWRAVGDGAARIIGARPLAPERFRAATAEELASARIPEESLGRVLVADAADVLPSSLPDWPKARNTYTYLPPAPWLFHGGEFQDFARWPNRISDDEYGWNTFTQCTSTNVGAIKILTNDDRPARWNFSNGVMLHGYWGYNWRDNYLVSTAWNAGTRELTLFGHPVYSPILGKQNYVLRWIAIDLPEELDAAREWHLDRATRRLFWIPPADFAARETVLCGNNGALLTLASGLHDVRFEGIEFAYANVPFKAKGAIARVEFEACRFHSFVGTPSFTGSDCAFRRCEFEHLGSGGLNVNGGDCPTLANGRNDVADCTFRDFERLQQTYVPAVQLNGCGNAVRNCTFAEASHEAVAYGGCEHMISGSDFSRVLRETADCGAIYTGRNASHLGTKIVACDFHDMTNRDVTAIYFDDCDWGDDVFACTFSDVYRGFLVGGGNLHRMRWNVITNADVGFHFDRRGVTWAYYVDWLANASDWWHDCYANAKIDPYAHPWLAYHPQAALTLDDQPNEPWNNALLDNLMIDCDEYTTLRTTTSYYASTNRMQISGNVTASTENKDGTGLLGFTHYKRAATADDVPGLAAARARFDALADAASAEVVSPGGEVRVRVGLDPTGRLCCRASYNGDDVVDPSPMGVTVDDVDYGRLMAPVTRQSTKAEAENDEWGSYAELVVPLESAEDGTTNAQAEVRAFADGFAWRMRVAGDGERNVAGETARWNLPDSGGFDCSEIPTNGCVAVGEVVTPWHVARFAPAAVTNGILVVDVPTGTTRPLSLSERIALAENAATNVVKIGGGTLLLATPLTGYLGAWHFTNGFCRVTAPTDAFGSAGDALIRVDTRKRSGGWGLRFACGGTVERPLEIKCADDQTLLFDEGTSVRFTKLVRFTSSALRLEIGANACATFAGGFSHPGYYTCLAGEGTIAFAETPALIGTLYAQHKTNVRFLCASNCIDRLECKYSSGGHMSFECADAIAARLPTVGDTMAFTWDLCGHDLAVGQMQMFTSGAIGSALPATLRTRHYGVVTNAGCAFTGQLSFEKRGGGEIAFARTIDSKGAMTVADGILRMTRAAAWPKATRLEAIENGTLIIEGDGQFGPSTLVRLRGNGKIKVAKGATLTCAGLRTAGGSLAAGTYAAGKIAGCSGDGEINVVPTGTVVIIR